MLRVFICCALVAFSASATAELPRAESFVVSDIKFGDSFERVQEQAKSIGFKPVVTQDFLPDGGYPASHAFQRFAKPCPECSRDPLDRRRDVLEVQYSRISQAVIAIGRRAPINPPVERSLVEQAIVERFGKDNSGRQGEYWWRTDGQLMSSRHCEGGGLPYLYRKKGCFLAANYVFWTESAKPDLATAQAVYVFDWATHDAELEVVEKGQLAKDKQELEESKHRAVPRL